MLWIIPIVILAVVVFVLWRGKKNSYTNKRRSEPLFKAEPIFIEKAEVVENEDQEEQPVIEIDQKQEPKKEALQELVVFRILADANCPYIGYELLQTLLANGLRFGEMNIFHRYEKADNQGRVLFSVAQVTEPGTFDIHNIGNCTCRGLVMFMQLADHKNPLQIFQLMLDTAKQLVDDLGGKIIDGKNQILDQMVAEHWRTRIKNYEASLYRYDLFAPELNQDK
jgi:cell division protein ZipA